MLSGKVVTLPACWNAEGRKARIATDGLLAHEEEKNEWQRTTRLAAAPPTDSARWANNSHAAVDHVKAPSPLKSRLRALGFPAGARKRRWDGKVAGATNKAPAINHAV